MIQKKLCIPLLALLLLAGCSQDTQHIRLPNSDLYDHPPAEAPLIIEPFTPDVMVPDLDLREVSMPTGSASTFAVNARGDVFFAKADGTVWNYTHGDGYACYFDGESSPRSPVYAFDSKPKQLFLEEFGGILLDENDSLWSWNAYSPDRSLTRLLDHVTDVTITFHEVLATDTSDRLWAVPRGSGIPQLLMESIRNCSSAGWPLALEVNGILHKITYTANTQTGALENIQTEQILQNIHTIDGHAAYGTDGTLYLLDQNLSPLTFFIGAVQTVSSRAGQLILDGYGKVWLQNGLTEPVQIAENVRQLIDHTEILYLTNDNDLCLFQNGNEILLASDVTEACAGFAMYEELHSIFYTKGDGILWRKGLTEDADRFDPLMEPERICNDLLSPFAEAEALSFEEPVFRLILSYAALPQHYRTMLESDAPFRDQLNSDTAEGFLQAIDTLQAFMDEQGLSVTRESLSHLTGLTIWNRGYNEGCVVELYVKDTRVSPFGILIPESLLYNIHSLEDLRYLPALERLELPPASIMSLAPLNELVHLKNCLSPASTH